MRKRTVFYVDDDPLWRRMIKRLFRDSEFEVRLAKNCADWTRQAVNRDPDCLLLDFNLGDGNAIDICRGLIKDGAKPVPPVIVLSADPDAEIPAYAECRADRFILKGSRILTELPQIIDKILRERAQPARRP